MSGIHARFHVMQGAFALNAEFTAPSRGVTGLFGPSGAGKSTLLRCIAGLQQTKNGYLSIGGEIWQDDSKRIFVPVHRRGIGYVFQEPGLFPHMKVRRNVLYGYHRIAGRERAIQFRDAVEWTGIAELLERMPGGLSGGERQRVAIARALMSSPKLLLMDEPLSALDEASRAEIIPCLDRLHRELSIPVIYVSHALREIARIADTLILIDAGRISKIGPIHDLLPAVCASADGDPFSVLDAPVFDHDDTYHLTRLQTQFGPLWSGRIGTEIGGVVRVQIAARDVSIGKTIDEQSSIVNQLPVRIHAVTELSAGHVLLELVPADDDGDSTVILSMITRRSWDHLQLAVGQTTYARIKGVSILR
ncbi:MAG: molybdenum ABC transporter ATP-binding protein [Candidatus Hydrogenedentes bacterium]|nr:molybdenum ABC transporter ATP-binding protein [Candidatus Hydrogenedentota bacterium]